MRLSRMFALLGLACLSVTMRAQFTLKKLVFQNPGPYSQDQLQKAWGMKPGQHFGQAELQKAAQNMIDTGVFDELNPQLEGPFSAITLTVTLKPVEPAKLEKVIFENFVWLTPQEIDTGLRARVPLFTGGVPEAGNLQDQMKTALVAMLAEKNVKADVASMRAEPSPLRPAGGIAFVITSPEVVLKSVQLSGIAADFQPKVNLGVRSLLNQPYTEDTDAANGILTVYRDAGYLDAKLDDVQRTVTISPSGTAEVVLTGTVRAGEVYHLGGVRWAGSDVLSSQQFQAKDPMHPGDVASRTKLLQASAVIADAYKHLGYMDVAVDPRPQPDTAAHTVSYDFQVAPGDQYRLHSVKTENLSAEQQQDFLKGWAMKPGDIFDMTYVTQFLKNNTALRSLSGLAGSFRSEANPATHQVDLVIAFARSKG